MVINHLLTGVILQVAVLTGMILQADPSLGRIFWSPNSGLPEGTGR